MMMSDDKRRRIVAKQRKLRNARKRAAKAAKRERNSRSEAPKVGAPLRKTDLGPSPLLALSVGDRSHQHFPLVRVELPCRGSAGVLPL